MLRSASTETFSLAESRKRGYRKKRKGKASRRSSVGDVSWPPLPEGSGLSSSSHDKTKPKQTPQHAFPELESSHDKTKLRQMPLHVFPEVYTPRGQTGGKKKLNLTAPMSANPRLSSISVLSPTTPRRSRTSAKLKMLWPPLDPLHSNPETQAIVPPAMSPASRRVSSPFQSPKAPQSVSMQTKRVSESVVHDIGKTLLSPMGKRSPKPPQSVSMQTKRVSESVVHDIGKTLLSPMGKRSPKPPQSVSMQTRRVSESVVHDIGKTLLSATGKRRTLKGVWPPPNLRAKQKQPTNETTQPGLTGVRKSMLNRSSTFGSSDGDAEKKNKIHSPKKPSSAQTLMSGSTSSSNDDWASVSDLNYRHPESVTSTPTKPPSSVSEEVVSENLDFVSLVLPSETDENDVDSNLHSSTRSIHDSNKKHVHSWEVWTDQQNQPDIPGDSPVFTPTHAAVSLGAKTDVTALPRAPDLVMSPHDRNRISFSQSSTPSTSGSSRPKVSVPTEGMHAAANNTNIDDSGVDGSVAEVPRRDIAAEPKIGRPPIDFSDEASDEVVKNYAEPQEPESQEGTGVTTIDANPTAIQEDAAPVGNGTLSIPLVPQTEDSENSQHSDESSIWSSEDEGPDIDERSVEGKYDEASTDADPTSPTVDTEDSWIPAERDGAEIGPPMFIVPEQIPLPPKTRVMGKRQRTEYRIRWEGPTNLDLGVYYPLIAIPEVEDLPERDDRFEKSKSDLGITMPVRSRRSSGDSNSLDCSIFSSDQSAGSDEISEKSQSSTHSRPSIHMRPAEEDEDEREHSKWKLKRVWDLQELDEKEKEHTVHRAEVMPSVKELCGVPEDIDLNDGNNETPWVIQKVKFVDGVEIELEEEEAFTSDQMMQQMETITSKKDKKSRKGKTKRERKSEKSDKKTAVDNSEKTKTTAKRQKKKKKSQKKKEKPKKRKSKKKDEEKGGTTSKAEVTSATVDESEQNAQQIPQPLPRFALPNGQKLPPTKRKKGRRTKYQLRYDGPTDLRFDELFRVPEEDNRFKQTDVDTSMMRRPVRRGSNPRDSFGASEEHDETPRKPSRTTSNDTLDFAEGSVDGDELKGSNHGDLDERGIKRPQVLMTARRAPAPEKMKWIVRRVWDIEEYDEKEDDHSVFDQDLPSKVRELFGVPKDENLELISESRFKDAASTCDSAPFLMRRIHDIDEEIDEVEVGVEFGTENLQRAIDHVNAEAKETVMWWDMVADSEPKKLPSIKKFIGKVKEPWYTHNVENEEKPKRVLPWHKRATPKKVEQEDVKMWWEE